MSKIREARLRRGLTQIEVAGLVGITPAAVSRIERGKIGVAPRRAHRWADVLGLSVDDILFQKKAA
ncbi:MAG: helix-turn-helix domain-containing protein [Xanthomonadales bacterium]|nr:helix-turn-helix domain-containing protein [Xanthomonadales bacterium]